MRNRYRPAEGGGHQPGLGLLEAQVLAVDPASGGAHTDVEGGARRYDGVDMAPDTPRKASSHSVSRIEAESFPAATAPHRSPAAAVAAALNVAMKEFRPPGFKLKTNDSDERLARCLSRWDTFDTTVVQVNDSLFFILDVQ
jgi:hypothetical protein